jgi:hypothetical protein
MKRNAAGVVISVREITDVDEVMVRCLLCGREFIPTLACDAFGIEDRRDADGEMPLQCEVCFDRGLARQGMGILDVSDPDNIQITPARTRSDDDEDAG